MATFQASASAPNCAYNESAEMPDAAFAAVLASARKRFGKVPVIVDGVQQINANTGEIAMRDMTNEETVKKMLGMFLFDWTNKAKDDAREAALEAINVQAPDWTVL